jgi:catechol 2,3-dioxygenase-like lactoylglutathione lyase family enzyme
VIRSIDRIVIAVPELAAAVAEYQALLGARFWPVPDKHSESRAWLGLANVTLELRQQVVAQPSIIALVFAGDAPSDTSLEVSNALELPLSICDGVDTARFRVAQGECQNPNLSVDHLVLRTADADACIDLFSVGLGIRLALDKNAPQWGARMLFFRVGKLTLEVVEPAEEKPEKDYFWGIAYQCSDLSITTQKLLKGGVTLSEVRPGRKPGTKVATVKSHSLVIPTLLIEPAA